jgi:hypothetical protein
MYQLVRDLVTRVQVLEAQVAQLTQPKPVPGHPDIVQGTLEQTRNRGDMLGEADEPQER